MHLSFVRLFFVLLPLLFLSSLDQNSISKSKTHVCFWLGRVTIQFHDKKTRVRQRNRGKRKSCLLLLVLDNDMVLCLLSRFFSTNKKSQLSSERVATLFRSSSSSTNKALLLLLLLGRGRGRRRLERRCCCRCCRAAARKRRRRQGPSRCRSDSPLGRRHYRRRGRERATHARRERREGVVRSGDSSVDARRRRCSVGPRS